MLPLLIFSPPISSVVEYHSIVVTFALFEEWYLVAYAKLYQLADVHVGLGYGLQIEVVEYAILHAEAYVVECLIDTHLSRLVEERSRPTPIDGMVAIVEVAHGVEEIYTPIDYCGEVPELELVVYGEATTHPAPSIRRCDIHAAIGLGVAYRVVVE